MLYIINIYIYIYIYVGAGLLSGTLELKCVYTAFFVAAGAWKSQVRGAN